MNKTDYKELANYIETQEKKHYESLITYFKWIVRISSLLISLALGLLGYNIYQIKQNVNKELETSRKYIDTLKAEAREYLANSQKQANLQIELIEKEAKINALSAVKLKLENELQRPQVQEFIYSELRNNIRNNLDILAEESFKSASIEFVDFTKETSKLNTAFQYAFWNDVSQMKYIDSIAHNSNDRRLREISTYMMEKLQERFLSYYGFKDEGRHSRQLLKSRRYKDISGYSDSELESYLIKKIFIETDIENVIPQFQALIDIANYNIKVLEFQALQELIETKQNN